MSGYLFASGPCFGCHRVFSFSPSLVPSYNGKPVCADCMARANAERSKLGLAPHPIMPGAYEPEEA